MIGKFLLSFWILALANLYENSVSANSWASSFLESLDEQNDAVIFQSVVDSMRQWTLQKKFHHRSKRDVSKVCYEDVGCFEDTGPFSYLEMLPSPPKDVGTRFLVYGSRKARSIPMEVPADDINDNANRAIDPDLPTKVIVHGFGSSCEHIWVYEMRSALMSVHECNIVCVDWGPGSAVPNYVRAAANTRLVGRQLAKLIRSLNVPLEKIHMIGFSLGAHVAGFAGAELGNVSRITGLDPAGPLFESQDPRARLDESDANFVDVIHSNGEQLILGGLGSWQPMGDVDFYPNGGRMQTGCSNIFLGAVSDIIWSSAVEGRSLCNHRRAYKFFTDSVSPKCRFPAFPCEQGYDGLLRGDCFPCGTNGMDKACGDMGYYSDGSPARGQLYLVTRDEEPFCAHQYQVKVYNSRSERPTRSYGKLQVTLVGEDSFNDTFAMTKKDEELLVGAVLQKIVVPHPAVLNLEAIEIKYTAYSGWISSGLVTWNIDKVAIADSFGKILSICKKGLILESGRSVYLPLFPGECHVPVESENSTSSDSSKFDRLMQEKPGGIGPFTKEQNYETKEEYTAEAFAKDRNPSKGLGPFTKEENLRLMNRKESYSGATSFAESTNHQRVTNNPWSILDISGDGDTNSLENLDSESGRAFSGSNFVPRSSASDKNTETTTENLPEIREPVLRANKKDAGRSLKLTEITEPILKPRSTRQNTKNEVTYRDKAKDEIQETSSTSSRAFTVQFLPERLAGILAQAERYARQTLLPLISQYTPSFVSSARNEPKYFPPLGDIVSEETIDYSKEFAEAGQPDGASESPEESLEVIDISKASSESVSSEVARSDDEKSSSKDVRNNANNAVIVEAVYPEKESSNSTVIEDHQGNVEMVMQSENNDWIPISELSTTFENLPSRRDLNASRSMELEVGHYNWSARSESGNSNFENMSSNLGSMDWVPITDKRDNPVSLNTESTSGEIDTASAPRTESFESKREETSAGKNDERRFIPLIDFKDGAPSSTGSNDILESQTSTVSYSHIQKIPRPNRTRIGITDRSSIGRSMVFPYAYERNKDPRTRYIPLIPEEDLGRSRLSFEKER